MTEPRCTVVCPEGLLAAGSPCCLDPGHEGPHKADVAPGTGSCWYDDYQPRETAPDTTPTGASER